MTYVRNALFSFAAANLALAPVAASAGPARAPSPVEQNEQFVGNWVVIALLLGALVPVGLLLASENEDAAAPASP